MGWLETLANSHPQAVIRNTEQEQLSNEVKSAQAQQLINEIMNRNQMMPYDIQKSIAASNQMNAQAEASRREKLIDPRKTAEAQRIQLEMLHPALGALIEPIKAAKNKQGGFNPALWEDNAASLNPIVSRLRESGLDQYADLLESKNFGQVEAFYNRMGMDKQRASLDKEDKRGANTVVLQDMRGQQALEQIDRKGAWSLRNAVAKAKFAAQKPSKETFENAAVAYERAAAAAEDPDEVERLLKKSKEYTDKANNLKAQGALVGPGAKVDAQLEALQKLKDWNKNIGGGDRANRLTEPKTISVEDMRKGL